MAQVSAEKLEHAGPAEKKVVASVPQKQQLASTPEPSLPKRKGTELSVQSTRSSGGHSVSEEQRDQQQRKEKDTSIPLQNNSES